MAAPMVIEATKQPNVLAILLCRSMTSVRGFLPAPHNKILDSAASGTYSYRTIPMSSLQFLQIYRAFMRSFLLIGRRRGAGRADVVGLHAQIDEQLTQSALLCLRSIRVYL